MNKRNKSQIDFFQKAGAMKHLLTFLTFFLLLSVNHLSGQQNYAVNVKTEISDDKMLITYDAPAPDGAKFYDVILMITYNGEKVQVNSVYGDYGSKIPPGNEKSIVWYYKNDFREDISKVKVNLFAYKLSEPQVVFRILSLSNNGYAPCEVKFSNSSSNVNEYRWNFGDPESGMNNLSTEKDPSHIFKNGGTYTIILEGKNSLLDISNTFYQSVEIKKHEPAKADFSFQITGKKAPYEVRFTNLSKNADQLSWNFGDPSAGAKNNTSSKANPSFKYKKAGTYRVTLKAKSSLSGLTDQVDKEVVIAAPSTPVARFVFTLSSESAPAIVVFNNTSTDADSYKWNFGDPGSGNSNTSSDSNPAHTYSNAGKYEVTLIATHEQSGKSSKFSDFVTVAGPPKPPVAGFKIENNNVISPASVIFVNTSTDADSYDWDFGDPSSGEKNYSTEKSPVHTYTLPGKYPVVLKASSSKTGQSNLFTSQVIITEGRKSPVAAFEIENNNETAPATVRFINNSANATSYSWNFGDSPSGSKNISTEKNPSHSYSRAGKYKVTLTVKNETGASHSYSADVVVTEAAKPPLARFTIDNNSVTGPATVGFSNTSENATSFRWDFGDPGSGVNNSSEEKNPKHTFERPGEYIVTLTVLDKNTGKSHQVTGKVNILEPVASPVAEFSFSSGGKYAPVDVIFSNSSRNADKFKWDFGDPASGKNNSSTGPSPVHRFENPGTYMVTLEATSSKTGKTDKTVKEVLISMKYPTFLKTFGNKNSDETGKALLATGPGQYLLLINEGKNSSSLVSINSKEEKFSEKKISGSYFDMVESPGNKGYILAGINEPNDLTISLADKKLNVEKPSVVYNNTNDPGFRFSDLWMTLNGKNEVGIVANLVNNKGEANLWFQKADTNGKPVIARGKTFRYIGLKVATRVIPMSGNGFAITGTWYKDSNSPREIIFGKVNAAGDGVMHLMRSNMDIRGCDLVELENGNFYILSAKEIYGDPVFSEINLKNVDNEITPLNCDVDMPGKTRTADVIKFPPRLLTVPEGFLVMSHVFNGTDSDIALFWMDKSGAILLRKEEIQLPGDQFGTNILRENDGSLIITGAQKKGNDFDAILIKTDPMGKYGD